ncbi:MAG TPA: S41 family peptidase [Pyrinomonadaceae bacterium]
MLQNVKDALKELYYDPKFRGIDVNARFKEAEKQISAAKSTWQINAIIAQVLLDFDDSHTTFYPPDLVVGVNYGFQMQMIGNRCYIIRTGPETEEKGLKVGDVVYSIEGFEPTRESLWKIIYSYFELLPPPTLRVTIQEADGRLREVVVNAVTSKKKRLKVIISDKSPRPPQYFDLSEDVIICKLAQFDLSDKEVDQMMKRIGSRKVLILDLRGNPGGFVSMEQRLLGYFFDRNVKIGDEKRRDRIETRFTKTRGKEKAFGGKVIVLVDSKSASAAEVFARIMQLEQRGVVVGDTTSGQVMTSTHVTFAFRSVLQYSTAPTLYGVNITVADLIMPDGKSLEKIGVTPDVVLLPSGADLAAKRDPVLAKAASLAGVELEAEKAGAIFPKVELDDEDQGGR